MQETRAAMVPTRAVPENFILGGVSGVWCELLEDDWRGVDSRGTLYNFWCRRC